jgi:hypothetical protein
MRDALWFWEESDQVLRLNSWIAQYDHNWSPLLVARPILREVMERL